MTAAKAEEEVEGTVERPGNREANAATEVRVKPPHGAATPRPRTKSYWGIGVVIVIGGIGLSVWRFSAYLERAQTMDARLTLAELGERASQAYGWNGKLCPSATRAVPETLAAVKGKSYHPRPNELVEAGFGCLGTFRDSPTLGGPTYFQYYYRSDANSFDVIAHGDLNGDGKPSTFILRGKVEKGRVVLADDLEIWDPLE